MTIQSFVGQWNLRCGRAAERNVTVAANFRTRRRLMHIIALVWLCLVSGGALATVVDRASHQQTLAGGVYFLVEDQALDIADILRLPQRVWTRVDGDINLGYRKQAHWFKFDLVNADSEAVARLLQISYPLLDNINIFQVADGRLLRSFATGDSLPFTQRPLAHRHFLFPLTLEGGQVYQVLMRVHTSGAMQVPMILWQEREFFVQDAKENAINSMYYGILLIMAAFNLLLYFSLREKTYLFYVFFVVSILVLMTSLNGYGFQYLYPSWPRFHGLLILLAVPVTLVAICLFTMHFFNFVELNKAWYRLFVCLIAASVLCMLGALWLSYNVSTRISLALSFPVILATLVAGIKFWRQGDRSARLFSIAWLAFLLGATGLVLNRIGVLPSSFLIEQAIPVSTTTQMLLFSLALASRFSVERGARKQAQQEYLQEIRKRREVETKLVYAASHHEITGLPNRLLFERALRPYIDNPPSGRECIAIVLLHVRRFDDVNKTLGHRNADVLLRRIGERIDSVVKFGQDALPIEHKADGAIFTAHVEGVSFCFALAKDNRENILQYIEGLIKKMSEPLAFMGLELELGFLVGCSFADESAIDPPTLLRQAFIAFDTASRSLSPIAIYQPAMNAYSPRRLTLMTELRSALEQDGLELFFQPQIHLASGRVAGFEALIRWFHADYGFVPPDEFIPMAEKTGLMKPLTRWVLGKAVAFGKHLDSLGCKANVSVNISAWNLREPDFCCQVREVLRQQALEADRLVLEVTETAAMVDPESAMSALGALQRADVRLSIDDFGTGHSSLAYIRKLPVHEIKIDRSFVGEMNMNKNDATIVKTTINMCHDLGYEVVAEGVESQAVVDMLIDMRCDIIQGYHIAKPMNHSDTCDWLSATRWKVDIS